MVITQIACFEHINPFNITTRYIELENPYDIKFASRVPDEYEIYINISGDVSFVVEDNIYPIKPGDIVITNPGEKHHCIHHSNNTHKYYWMLFSEINNRELLSVFLNRIPGNDNIISTNTTIFNEITGLFKELINTAENTMKKYINFFKILEIIESAQSSSDGSSLHNDTFSDAVNYMNTHYCEKITIKDVSKHVHVSVNTLERHFKTRVNMTPAMYLKKVRLAKALDCLLLGYSVQQACDISGFSDCSKFISHFKSMYGITPLKYVKNKFSKRY